MRYLFAISPAEVNPIPSDNFHRELQQSVARLHKDTFHEEYQKVKHKLFNGEQVEIAGRTFKIEG